MPSGLAEPVAAFYDDDEDDLYIINNLSGVRSELWKINTSNTTDTSGDFGKVADFSFKIQGATYYNPS